MSILMLLTVNVSKNIACQHVQFDDLVKEIALKYQGTEQPSSNLNFDINGFTVHVNKLTCRYANKKTGMALEKQIDESMIDTVQATAKVIGKTESSQSKFPIEGAQVYSISDLKKIKTKTIKADNKQKLENKLPTQEMFREFGLGGMFSEVQFITKYIFFWKIHQKSFAKLSQQNGGLFLYGPPGSGKTFLAETIGKVWQKIEGEQMVKVTYVHGPQLFNSYIGETEKAVRTLFADAEENLKQHKESNCVVELQQHLVIIDEIDSMFGTRGSDSTSGAADRATASFISMMDKKELRSNLFFIGTSNRYDLVDPAVIRKGRIGFHLEISALNTEEKLDILRLNLQKIQEDERDEKKQSNKDQTSEIISCFKEKYSHMTVAMIGDAIQRALIDQKMQSLKFMDVEHFENACKMLLDDKTDPQNLFRQLLDSYTCLSYQTYQTQIIDKAMNQFLKKDKVVMAIENSNVELRLNVAINIYFQLKQCFDKVWFINHAMLNTIEPQKRLKKLSDQINDFCRYKGEKKLLIIDQVEFFCDQSSESELMSIISSICTLNGQMLMGNQSTQSGFLKVILCQDSQWTQKLLRLGIDVAIINFDATKISKKNAFNMTTCIIF